MGAPHRRSLLRSPSTAGLGARRPGQGAMVVAVSGGSGVVQAEERVGAGATGAGGLDGEVGEQGLVLVVPGGGPPVTAVGVVAQQRGQGGAVGASWGQVGPRPLGVEDLGAEGDRAGA